MKQDEIESGKLEGQNPYNQGTDNEDMLHMGDSRKPPLTLKHLNKLRKMKELRKLEQIQQDEFNQIMYALPQEESSPLG